MKTIQEIIENQENFKKEIYNWFESDFENCKKILNGISSKDNFIKKEKKNYNLK